MIPLLKNHLEPLKTACTRHGVARLEVFGSAADPGAFDAARSDVDFIVSFPRDTDLGPWLKVYFELRDELCRILGRPVDLIMESAMRNPLFQREANRTREVLYTAQDTKAP